MAYFISKKKCKTLACVLVVAAVLGVLHNRTGSSVNIPEDDVNGESSESYIEARHFRRKSRRQDVDDFGKSAINNPQRVEKDIYNTHAQKMPTRNTETHVTMETQEKHLARLQEEQERRKEAIRNVCARRREEISSVEELYDDTQRHIYVIDKYKLMFCYIPKVGCSNWKRILMILENNLRTIDDIDSREAHSRNKLKVLRYYTGRQREFRLQNYRKFMFVRHPLSRIVSAYKNKYGDLSVFRVAPLVLRRYAMRIMKKYRANPTPMELQTGENITWPEWLQYIADPSEQRKFDRHWKEMYKLCSPCAINYDYIGKLENMKEEADYIMDKLEISQVVRYPGKENSHPTNTSTSGYEDKFKDATQYQLKRISQIYDLDFQLFGYSKPDILT